MNTAIQETKIFLNKRLIQYDRQALYICCSIKNIAYSLVANGKIASGTFYRNNFEDKTISQLLQVIQDSVKCKSSQFISGSPLEFESVELSIKDKIVAISSETIHALTDYLDAPYYPVGTAYLENVAIRMDFSSDNIISEAISHLVPDLSSIEEQLAYFSCLTSLYTSLDTMTIGI